MRDFRKLRGMPEQSIRALRKKIFGKLVHRWTRTKFCTAFNGDEDWTEVKYRVLAKDEGGVALWVSADPESWVFEDEDHILHIHFDGPDYYWIPLEMGPGLTREWFRRLETPRRCKRSSKK
jgi:hypothetical protein